MINVTRDSANVIMSFNLGSSSATLAIGQVTVDRHRRIGLVCAHLASATLKKPKSRQVGRQIHQEMVLTFTASLRPTPTRSAALSESAGKDACQTNVHQRGECRRAKT